MRKYMEYMSHPSNCAINSALVKSLSEIHWVSKETYLFFRETLTNIHRIKIKYIVVRPKRRIDQNG